MQHLETRVRVIHAHIGDNDVVGLRPVEDLLDSLRGISELSTSYPSLSSVD